MLRLRSFVLPTALACSACSGSPIESASGAAQADDDGDDVTSDASTTDRTSEPSLDDTTDASAELDEVTSAAGDLEAGDPSSEGGSEATGASADGDASTDDGADADCHPELNELAVNVDFNDFTLEWIAIHNPCGAAIDLADYALGWAGSDYTYGTHALAGVIEPGGCFVLGGPDANGTNYDPELDLVADFDPDLQNAGANDADAVGLFLGAAEAITPESVPIDAVVYGTANVHALVDETGQTAAVDVEQGTDLDTIARRPDGSWVVNPSPSPNDCASPTS